jgi:hypothetical protein
VVFQSIVLYSLLILTLVSFSKLYALQNTIFSVTENRLNVSGSGFKYLVVIMLSFSIMMGIRYDVGTDYLAYQEGYIYNFDVGKGEVIFNWIRELFNRLNLHYSIYFGFLAFLNISFFVLAFKRDAFILPLLLFFLIVNGDWLFWMNGIRQAIAMCIWIYALNFIERKKIWYYLFYCIVAIGFHKSAIILLPLYPLLKNGKDYFNNINWQLILLVGAFIVQYSFGSFLIQIEPLIEFYQSKLSGGVYNYTMDRFTEEASTEVGGSGVAYYFRILLCIVIIVYSKKLKQFYKSKWFNIIYFLFFLGLLIQNIFPLGSIVITRPFRFFFIFKGIMFAYFVFYLLKSKSPNYYLFGVSLIIVFVAIFYLNIVNADENSHLWYRFYWEQ